MIRGLVSARRRAMRFRVPDFPDPDLRECDPEDLLLFSLATDPQASQRSRIVGVDSYERRGRPPTEFAGGRPRVGLVRLVERHSS